jgi:ribonuclease-3
VAERRRRPVAHSQSERPLERKPGGSARSSGRSIAQHPEPQETIGYRFRQPILLEEALTHKSYANELKHKGMKHNERLEFLGDAVLTLIISEHLAAAFPVSPEGELSKRKAQLVSEASLAGAARRLSLGGLLRLGRGEELTKGREKSSLLANVLEAILGAIYLDGGIEPARVFTMRVLQTELQGGESTGAGQDYKTQLQEWCQREFETLPHYDTVREFGPDHEKTFEVQLTVQGNVLATGVGRSKKEAEQMAAKAALIRAANH